MTNPISATSRDMGRPPSKLKPTVIRLSKEMMERIDAVAGEHRRAEFIREAVELELKRRERERQKGRSS
jgi:metal-responsive CopG/Arc/MetJ family transcriptional regulator